MLLYLRMRFIASSMVVSEILFLRGIRSERLRSCLQRRFSQLGERDALRLDHLGRSALAEKLHKSGDATHANVLIRLVAALHSGNEGEWTFFRMMTSRSVRSGREGRTVWRH